MATELNVTELAEKLDTTPRTARKFLRAVTDKDEQPGKGGRWKIAGKDVRSLTKKFKTWQDEHTRTPDVDDASDEEIDSE